MTDPIREAFENDYRREWPGACPSVLAPDCFSDEYANRYIQARWEGWQAAWQQSRREALAELCERAERAAMDGNIRCAVTAMRMVEVIRAAAEEKRK